MVVISNGLDEDEETADLEALEVAFFLAKPEATVREWSEILRWARRRAAPRYRHRELARRLGLGVSHV
jgi:hypothetical protein